MPVPFSADVAAGDSILATQQIQLRDDIGMGSTAGHDHGGTHGRTLNASAIAAGTLPHERGGLEANVSAGDGYVEVKGGSTTVIKSNLAATVAPTVNEDGGDGYAVGSVWIDVTADKAYVLLDATVGAAVWAEISPPPSSAVEQANEDEIEDEAEEDKYIPPNLMRRVPGVCKGYCTVALDGTLQANSHNVASSARGSTGTYTVTWATDFGNNNYACVGTPEYNENHVRLQNTVAVGTVTIQVLDNSHSLADSPFHVAAFGDQNV
jgi:hypothetical protein